MAMEVPTNLERVDKDPLEWDELQEARELLATRRAEEVRGGEGSLVML